MVLDNLGENLKGTLKKIVNASRVDKKLIKEVVKDIQRALLQSDMNVKQVLAMTKQVETRALEEKPAPGTNMREHVVKIIYQELVELLGEKKDLGIKKQVIMMVGLYGQGKTTTSGKLARYFQKRGLRVGMIAADVHRPAAYEQLKQIGDQINVPVFGSPDSKNAVKVVSAGMKEMKDFDVRIIDTSGRHSLEEDLIREIENVAKVAKPDHRILVIDAAVGQQAGPQAKRFNEAVDVNGVIITKMDGTAKAGGALSAVAETEAPVVFIGVGEKLEDLESFDPSRFISRLLGMGDLRSLIEKAEEVIDEEQAEKTMKRIMAGKFTLKDMYEQMEMVSSMGPMKKIMSMLPGMGANLSDEELEDTQRKLRQYKIIMDSMTGQEKDEPKLIKKTRIVRIARGAGVRPSEVRGLLKHYKSSKKMMKGITGNRRMRKQLQKQIKQGGFDGMM